MNETTTRTKNADQATTANAQVNADAVVPIPLGHRLALTLFMATQSELQQNKNNDTFVTGFLNRSGVPAGMHQQYKNTIKKFDSSTALSDSLKTTGTLLRQVMGGGFYPTNPCPLTGEAERIMGFLKVIT